MDQKLLITYEKIAERTHGFYICALYEGDRMVEAAIQPAESENILNNIYVARVQNVVPNLHAAFVEIGDGQRCFLPLDELKKNNPFFTKKISKKPVAAGDELVVQVIKEAMKTKDAVVTTNISFAGEHLVLTSANRIIGISSKLAGEDRKRLQTLAGSLRGEDTHYGLILRTNAAAAKEDTVREEFLRLKGEYETLVSHAASRTVYSCLCRERPPYWKMFVDADKSRLKEVITDIPDVFEAFRAHPMPDTCPLRLYEDRMLPLSALYSMKSQLEAALKPRVWLKSGANIIIQPTEALTVIDVNSGKNIGKKNKEETHYRINIEAAAEIARQLRLRGISGIIIVDFIDLCDDARNASLLAEFRAYLKKDPVPVQLVGMTGLGLVELTRKKLKKPLAEQLELCK